jgi:hypothetical protein
VGGEQLLSDLGILRVQRQAKADQQGGKVTTPL